MDENRLENQLLSINLYKGRPGQLNGQIDCLNEFLDYMNIHSAKEYKSSFNGGIGRNGTNNEDGLISRIIVKEPNPLDNKLKRWILSRFYNRTFCPPKDLPTDSISLFEHIYEEASRKIVDTSSEGTSIYLTLPENVNGSIIKVNLRLYKSGRWGNGTCTFTGGSWISMSPGYVGLETVYSLIGKAENEKFFKALNKILKKG